jgi:formylmethanofuran dehydrogenase subunit E
MSQRKKAYTLAKSAKVGETVKCAGCGDMFVKTKSENTGKKKMNILLYVIGRRVGMNTN